MEQLRCQELCDEIKRLKDQLDHMNKLSRMDQATMAELRTVIGKFFFPYFFIIIHPIQYTFIVESAWMQKDAAQSREQITQDEMLKLREKVESLEQMVEHLSDKRSGLQRWDWVKQLL